MKIAGIIKRFLWVLWVLLFIIVITIGLITWLPFWVITGKFWWSVVMNISNKLTDWFWSWDIKPTQKTEGGAEQQMWHDIQNKERGDDI